MVLSSQNRRSAIFLLSRLVTKRKKKFENNTSLKFITRRKSKGRNAQYCSEKTMTRKKKCVHSRILCTIRFYSELFFSEAQIKVNEVVSSKLCPKKIFY